jgi:hypothetical protein
MLAATCTFSDGGGANGVQCPRVYPELRHVDQFHLSGHVGSPLRQSEIRHRRVQTIAFAFATVAPAATGLNRHSPGSASPPGLSTSALGQDLEFARKRPLSQCWIEAPVPYVEIRSCPNSNGGTIEAD